MSQYFLRVEAVNLGNFVYDTQDLSTVRGGGLLLLNAVEKLADLVQPTNLKVLTTGASIGLYEFEATDLTTAQAVRDAVQTTLANDAKLQHATFVVSFQPKSDDQSFARDIEVLQAKNRWQQMQSPSLALSSAQGVQVCEIDLVRAATRDVSAPENKTWRVSESVATRRQVGQQLKQKFYEEHIGRPLQRNFTHELNELTEDKAKGNLNGKMALIYLDGNQFGFIKRSVSNSRAEWLKFDQTVQSYRRAMLEGLLDCMEADSDWQTCKGKHRVETLLWGGDELMWIVPAWKGWEALQYFYQQSEKWQFKGQPLRHSGGLVFCHHNAPIHRITALAQNLAKLAKAKSRAQNLFAYEVLESFDHVGRDLEAYRRERSPQPVTTTDSLNPETLILDGMTMAALGDFVYDYAEELPRKPLHELTEELLTALRPTDSVTQRESTRKQLLKRLQSAAIKAGKPEDALQQLFNSFGEQSFWLHANALWDYLV
ncbi:MAG: hypothetical protein HYR56_21235 [Acidobacteria bacterium]|nr:hypothetical protein [Acidobacteriota bacterium]MBI3427570.1 hypothetical protein [Acidobacteriota bacterium]